jgi:hypothetical protein
LSGNNCGGDALILHLAEGQTIAERAQQTPMTLAWFEMKEAAS